jgi:hypothetical protein
MDKLLFDMEDRKVPYLALPSDEITCHIITLINNAWSLLDMYYKMVDETPVLYSVIPLQPEMKLQWFREDWQESPSWIAAAEQEARDDWVTEFLFKQPPVLPSGILSITISEASIVMPMWKSKQAPRQTADTLDQFEWFQDQDPDDELPTGTELRGFIIRASHGLLTWVLS